MKTVKPTTKPSVKLIADSANGETTHDEIALCAYSLWQQQGCPSNHELENWLQAEMQLRQSRQPAAAKL
jgi:hypothetical protein